MHRYKCWRANGNEDRGDPNGLIHVLCHEGEAFEMLPARIRRLGPWIGSREGEIANLKPHYRKLLASRASLSCTAGPPNFSPSRQRRGVSEHLAAVLVGLAPAGTLDLDPLGPRAGAVRGFTTLARISVAMASNARFAQANRLAYARPRGARLVGHLRRACDLDYYTKKRRNNFQTS